MIKNNTLFLKTKDFSVSGEVFELHQNDACDFLETLPRPLKQDLPSYYNSSQYVSHQTSKRNLFDWAYFFVRWFTLKKKIKLISRFSFERQTLLDYGAGVGYFVRSTRSAGWESIGIESSVEARRAANLILENSIFDESHTKKLKSKSQSIISLWHVLEHLPDLKQNIKEFDRLLSQDGRLIVAVPNFKSYDAQYFKNFWAAYDVPRHLWHFSPKSIVRLFSEFGFELESTYPMRFDAYYVSLLSTKYKYGKMSIAKAFFIGFQSNLRAKRSGHYSSLIYVFKRKKT
jgi:2-polyprenyl-3-methyl-5-hydroxy-6-metoxy-1,4-benzoquinol methylase